MAVGASYLNKIRFAVRRNQATEVDQELTDIIEECRLDLQSLGVLASKTTDETDGLILGAVRCFARWKFGLDSSDAEQNREDYMQLRDELRRRRDYIGYAITFTVKVGETALADASVTFNGETKETNSSGHAVFYYINAGVNQEYTVEKTGYTTVSSDVDVTATATVNVAMTAG